MQGDITTERQCFPHQIDAPLAKGIVGAVNEKANRFQAVLEALRCGMIELSSTFSKQERYHDQPIVPRCVVNRSGVLLCAIRQGEIDDCPLRALSTAPAHNGNGVSFTA